MAVFHFFLPPIASFVYAVKTQYWWPFILATVVGLGTTLISAIVAFVVTSSADPSAAALVSFLISSTLGLIPMAISFFMYRSRAMRVRSRNDIQQPEQADQLLAETLAMQSPS